jgi:hypothetical protein
MLLNDFVLILGSLFFILKIIYKITHSHTFTKYVFDLLKIRYMTISVILCLILKLLLRLDKNCLKYQSNILFFKRNKLFIILKICCVIMSNTYVLYIKQIQRIKMSSLLLISFIFNHVA